MLHNPLHNRLHARIGISALAVGFLAGFLAGLLAAILVTLYWRHDHSFEHFLAGYEQIYQLSAAGTESSFSGVI